jgi:hypothetical protein
MGASHLTYQSKATGQHTTTVISFIPTARRSALHEGKETGGQPSYHRGGAVGDDIKEKAKTPTATSTLFQMVLGVALESAHGDSKSQSDSSVFT